MKTLKNRYIEAQKNSPSRGGFSDIRIRLFVLACMSTILILSPFFGMIYSSAVVILFGTFLAIKRHEFERCDFESTYNHMKEMDRLYGGGVDIESCRMIVRWNQIRYKRTAVKPQPAAKQVKQPEYSASLKLSLN